MRITRKIPLKGDQPPKRSDHSLVKFKEYLFIFGGCEDQSKHNDLYRIDLNSNTVVSPLTSRFRKSRSMEKCLSRGLATVPRWWEPLCSCSADGTVLKPKTSFISSVLVVLSDNSE